MQIDLDLALNHTEVTQINIINIPVSEKKTFLRVLFNLRICNILGETLVYNTIGLWKLILNHGRYLTFWALIMLLN